MGHAFLHETRCIYTDLSTLCAWSRSRYTMRELPKCPAVAWSTERPATGPGTSWLGDEGSVSKPHAPLQTTLRRNSESDSEAFRGRSDRLLVRGLLLILAPAGGSQLKKKQWTRIDVLAAIIFWQFQWWPSPNVRGLSSQSRRPRGKYLDLSSTTVSFNKNSIEY
jgi:hypothetical protein